MPVHRAAEHRAAAPAPSEASFVLRRRSNAIWVRPSDREAAPLVSQAQTAPAPPNGRVSLSAAPPASPGAAPRTPRGGKARGAAGDPKGREAGPAEDRATEAVDRPEGAAPGPSLTRIGIVSDNHGYLDPEVLEVFAGVTHIIHAGDIMDPDILARLEAVAPVTAVSGNMDGGELGAALPREAVGEIAGVRFVVGHKRKRLLKRLYAGKIEGLPAGEAPDLVIYGHDHVAAAAWVDDTLFLNPGTASSPDDEDDGPTVAIVEKRRTGLAVVFVPLERRNAEDVPERPARA
jgi:uncharacterized protein